MELPDTCTCGQINMIDYENLTSRPLGKLYTEYGYSCKACGNWKPCLISSRQLDEKLRKLTEMSPDHPSFPYHFAKAVKRAQEVNKRARSVHGSVGI